MKKVFRLLLTAFSLSIILSLISCASAATPLFPEPSPTNPPQPTSTPGVNATPEQIIQDNPLTVAEAEKLAGFEVKEPAYLPKGVFFEYAAYETPGFPGVTLHFKFIHEQYGDVGHFFFIGQERKAEAPPEAVSCGEMTEGCEVLEVNGVPVIYHAYSSADEGRITEGFDWYADGFSFRLHRMAGEPNKIYKEELLKVVESMK